MRNKNSSEQNFISVLVDRSLLGLSVIVQYVIKEQTVQWGDFTVIAPTTGIQRIKPENEEKRRNIERLPTLAKLAQEGKIKLFTYPELNFEGLRVPVGLAGAAGDLFRDISFENVPAAVDRSYFGAMDFSKCINKEEFVEFCKLLISLEPEKITNFSEFSSFFPKFQQNNLNNLDRFKEISTSLTDEQLIDAFHLWTAETNNLDYFLTRDTTFVNVMTKTKRIDLPTPPITLEVLLQKLNVTELDPLPISDNDFHVYNFASPKMKFMFS